VVPTDIPADVRRFIVDHVHSVEQLEILLLLHRHPARWWTASDVNAEIRTSLASADDRLRDLAERGLAGVDAGTPPRYRFAPAEGATAVLVSRVAETYREHRVSVVTLIYSKPSDAVRDLAEAFRLGRGKTDKSDG
jgi:hypothetical protein